MTTSTRTITITLPTKWETKAPVHGAISIDTTDWTEDFILHELGRGITEDLSNAGAVPKGTSEADRKVKVQSTIDRLNDGALPQSGFGGGGLSEVERKCREIVTDNLVKKGQKRDAAKKAAKTWRKVVPADKQQAVIDAAKAELAKTAALF